LISTYLGVRIDGIGGFGVLGRVMGMSILKLANFFCFSFTSHSQKTPKNKVSPQKQNITYLYPAIGKSFLSKER